MNITVLVKPVPYKSIVDNDGNVMFDVSFDKYIVRSIDKCLTMLEEKGMSKPFVKKEKM